jgi:hypothetical protein
MTYFEDNRMHIHGPGAGLLLLTPGWLLLAVALWRARSAPGWRRSRGPY